MKPLVYTLYGLNGIRQLDLQTGIIINGNRIAELSNHGVFGHIDSVYHQGCHENNCHQNDSYDQISVLGRILFYGCHVNPPFFDSSIVYFCGFLSHSSALSMLIPLPSSSFCTLGRILSIASIYRRKVVTSLESA